MKDRLKMARKAKKLSQTRLAELLNVSQAAIQSLESGRVKSTTFLVELAEKLDVTPEWLVDGEQTGNILHLNYPTGNIAKSLPFLRIEEAQQWIANGILPTNVGTIQMLSNIQVSKKSFCIEIEGDAMVSTTEPSKSLFPGFIAIVDPERQINSGDIVFAELNQKDLKIRQYMRDGNEIILKSHNNSYSIIPVDLNTKIIGVIVSIQKNLVKAENV